MNLKVYDDSKNYTCQVIKLPNKRTIKGLDNLVEVVVQGNSCLIGKDSPENELYLFFPAESQISHEFLNLNDLYRHQELNSTPDVKGFFEDTRRVKAIKFRGIISSGFVIPAVSLLDMYPGTPKLSVGDEFNELDGKEICRKYVRRLNPGKKGFQNPRTSKIDEIVDRIYAPEHIDTAQLMRNTGKLNLDDNVIITYKLHGTSGRTFNALCKRKLGWKDKLAKLFGVKVVEEEYNYVAASRRQIKSVGFEELPGKNHYYTDGDLWSEWSKKNLEGRLNKGEAIYYELVGKTYSGEEIQGGYSYGFTNPECFIYRISNINADGIEIDLPHDLVVKRAAELNLKVVPTFFKGTLGAFIEKYDRGQTYVEFEEPLTRIFYNRLLDQPSIFDSSVVEEGFCLRIEGSPRAEIYKIKSKIFLANESKALDKEVVNMEDEESQIPEHEIQDSL